MNGADAAGLAEMRWGAGHGVEGVVLMLTLGTSIGTTLFIEGKLVPNTKLGHIEIHGKEAELWTADREAGKGRGPRVPSVVTGSPPDTLRNA